MVSRPGDDDVEVELVDEANGDCEDDEQQEDNNIGEHFDAPHFDDEDAICKKNGTNRQNTRGFLSASPVVEAKHRWGAGNRLCGKVEALVRCVHNVSICRYLGRYGGIHAILTFLGRMSPYPTVTPHVAELESGIWRSRGCSRSKADRPARDDCSSNRHSRPRINPLHSPPLSSCDETEEERYLGDGGGENRWRCPGQGIAFLP